MSHSIPKPASNRTTARAGSTSARRAKLVTAAATTMAGVGVVGLLAAGADQSLLGLDTSSASPSSTAQSSSGSATDATTSGSSDPGGMTNERRDGRHRLTADQIVTFTPALEKHHRNRGDDDRAGQSDDHRDPARRAESGESGEAPDAGRTSADDTSRGSTDSSSATARPASPGVSARASSHGS